MAHVRTHHDWHNEWNELKADMFISRDLWKCPTCSFHAITEGKVREHCLVFCVDRHRYRALEQINHDRRSNWDNHIGAEGKVRPAIEDSTDPDPYPIIQTAVMEAFKELPFLDTEEFPRLIATHGLGYDNDQIQQMAATFEKVQAFCNTHITSSAAAETPVVPLNFVDMAALGYHQPGGVEGSGNSRLKNKARRKQKETDQDSMDD